MTLRFGLYEVHGDLCSERDIQTSELNTNLQEEPIAMFSPGLK